MGTLSAAQIELRLHRGARPARSGPQRAAPLGRQGHERQGVARAPVADRLGGEGFAQLAPGRR
eukprot:12684403-Alexandrium_andersonii.AAC.1